jgi:hypothetical protein
MSEDGGDNWTRIADEVGCVTKGNHAEALRGEIRPAPLRRIKVVENLSTWAPARSGFPTNFHSGT